MIKKILAVILMTFAALALLVGSVNLIVYLNMVTGETLRVSVDLSNKGTYKANFQRESFREHGQQIRLEVEPGFKSEADAALGLKAFVGQVSIFDPSGEMLSSKEITALDFVTSPLEGCRGAATRDPYVPYLLWSPKKTWSKCQFLITVKQGAKNLRGLNQELVSKTVYCRSSQASSFLVSFIFIAGGILFCFLGRKLYKAKAGE